MKSKCAAFWMHTNIRSGDRVFPCCRFKNPIFTFDGDLEKILLTPEYQDLRSKSSNGDYIPGCEKCYEEESLGKESLRQKFNNEYVNDNINLEFLEIGFDNICNLTCDGCYPEFSSAWSKKLNNNTIYIQSTKEITSIPKTIKKVLFLGGEPLMTNRHQKFLKLIDKPENVEVTYNTNATFLLDDITIALLQNFAKVKFIVSIDGYAELNETVRSGSDWTEVISFIQQIKSLQFDISVNTVVHKNNWFGLKTLETFIVKEQLPWTVNFLTYPRNLDIQTLDNKQELIEMFESIHAVDLSHLIKRIKNEII